MVNTIFWSCIVLSMWGNFRGRAGPTHFRGSTAWAALELWCRAELERLPQGCFWDNIAMCQSVEAMRTWGEGSLLSEATLATGPDKLNVGSCACPQRPPACFFPSLQAFFPVFFPCCWDLSLFFNARVIGSVTHYHIRLLPGCWKSELGASCLFSKHCTYLTISSAFCITFQEQGYTCPSSEEGSS